MGQLIAPMKITVFGSLSVQSGLRHLGPSSFGGRKPKALLELLLLARGRAVSKEKLAEALWPGTLPKSVSGTLETYVSVLRRQMFEDRVQARRVIVTAPGAYRFVVGEVTLDIDRFDDLLGRAERVGSKDRRALWIEAVGLATGDILEDEPYASWAQRDRDLYSDRVVRTHLLIAEDALADGQFITSLRHAEAALGVDPLSEAAFRALMLANYALGHSEAARVAFTRCRDVVARELDGDPTTTTVKLAGAIDAGTPARELIGSARVPSPPPPGDHARERRDPAGRMPFLGRGAELARLRVHIAASTNGQFTVVLVEGRPGFGRTAVLDQLQRSVGGVVGRAAYSTRDIENPSLPLASALQDALRPTPAAAEAELYANAPWLSGGPPALESLLRLMRGHSPLVLLLDDLQWADQDTLGALEWLQQRAPELPAAIIATMRSPGHGGLPRCGLGGADRLRLGALTPADSFGIDGVDDDLLAAAGGNPRLLADIWRWKQAGRAGWPPSLEQTVKRRVRGMGGCLPSLLQAAATLPQPFNLIDLLSVSGGTRDEGLAAELEHLSALQLLEPTMDGFRFVEPVVREVLAATVSSESRDQPAGPDEDDPRSAAAA